MQFLRVYALYSGSKGVVAIMTATGIGLGGLCVVCSAHSRLSTLLLSHRSNKKWAISDQAAMGGKPTEIGCHVVTTSKTS